MLKYVCDSCGDLADFVVRVKEAESMPGGIEIHSYAKADACTADLGDIVTQMVKIHQAHDYDIVRGISFHGITVEELNQDDAERTETE